MTTLKDETEDDEDTTQTTFESVSKTSTPNTVSQRTQSFTKTSFFLDLSQDMSSSGFPPKMRPLIG